MNNVTHRIYVQTLLNRSRTATYWGNNSYYRSESSSTFIIYVCEQRSLMNAELVTVRILLDVSADTNRFPDVILSCLHPCLINVFVFLM